jgi:hypothetical protein
LEAHESSELIEAHHGSSQKNRTALTISILAMILAIANLGGSNSAKEAAQENILAANAYSFYQAKTIRQTSLKIAATELDLQMQRDPTMPGNVREAFRGKIDDYRKTIDRYESEPENGEGKKELLARAKEHEKNRDHALRQDPWFDYAAGMLQIAIVLLSVSIIASMNALFLGGALLGCLGLLATLNGFLLVV